MNTPTIPQASEVIEDGITKPKILEVWRELAPVNGNPGLFWIGWARPFTDGDFRSLRRFLVCWRAPDLDKNGLVGLDEGWRITGEGFSRTYSGFFPALVFVAVIDSFAVFVWHSPDRYDSYSIYNFIMDVLMLRQLGTGNHDDPFIPDHHGRSCHHWIPM